MKDIGVALLSLDQFEALRLCDLEDYDQSQAGEMMGVSRGTIQRLLYCGRSLIVEAILNNKAIIINLNESEVNHVGVHSNQRRCRSRGPGV